MPDPLVVVKLRISFDGGRRAIGSAASASVAKVWNNEKGAWMQWRREAIHHNLAISVINEEVTPLEGAIQVVYNIFDTTGVWTRLQRCELENPDRHPHEGPP